MSHDPVFPQHIVEHIDTLINRHQERVVTAPKIRTIANNGHIYVKTVKVPRLTRRLLMSRIVELGYPLFLEEYATEEAVEALAAAARRDVFG